MVNSYTVFYIYTQPRKENNEQSSWNLANCKLFQNQIRPSVPITCPTKIQSRGHRHLYLQHAAHFDHCKTFVMDRWHVKVSEVR